jgi:hypothetical protein
VVDEPIREGLADLETGIEPVEKTIEHRPKCSRPIYEGVRAVRPGGTHPSEGSCRWWNAAEDRAAPEEVRPLVLEPERGTTRKRDAESRFLQLGASSPTDRGLFHVAPPWRRQARP